MLDRSEPLWTRDPTGLFWAPPGDQYKDGCWGCALVVLAIGASVLALGLGYQAFGPNPVLIGAAMVAAFVLVWKLGFALVERSDRPSPKAAVSPN